MSDAVSPGCSSNAALLLQFEKLQEEWEKVQAGRPVSRLRSREPSPPLYVPAVTPNAPSTQDGASRARCSSAQAVRPAERSAAPSRGLATTGQPTPTRKDATPVVGTTPQGQRPRRKGVRASPPPWDNSPAPPAAQSDSANAAPELHAREQQQAPGGALQHRSSQGAAAGARNTPDTRSSSAAGAAPAAEAGTPAPSSARPPRSPRVSGSGSGPRGRRVSASSGGGSAREAGTTSPAPLATQRAPFPPSASHTDLAGAPTTAQRPPAPALLDSHTSGLSDSVLTDSLAVSAEGPGIKSESIKSLIAGGTGKEHDPAYLRKLSALKRAPRPATPPDASRAASAVHRARAGSAPQPPAAAATSRAASPLRTVRGAPLTQSDELIARFITETVSPSVSSSFGGLSGEIDGVLMSGESRRGSPLRRVGSPLKGGEGGGGQNQAPAWPALSQGPPHANEALQPTPAQPASRESSAARPRRPWRNITAQPAPAGAEAATHAADSAGSGAGDAGGEATAWRTRQTATATVAATAGHSEAQRHHTHTADWVGFQPQDSLSHSTARPIAPQHAQHVPGSHSQHAQHATAQPASQHAAHPQPHAHHWPTPPQLQPYEDPRAHHTPQSSYHAGPQHSYFASHDSLGTSHAQQGDPWLAGWGQQDSRSASLAAQPQLQPQQPHQTRYGSDVPSGGYGPAPFAQTPLPPFPPPQAAAQPHDSFSQGHGHTDHTNQPGHTGHTPFYLVSEYERRDAYERPRRGVWAVGGGGAGAGMPAAGQAAYGGSGPPQPPQAAAAGALQPRLSARAAQAYGGDAAHWGQGYVQAPEPYAGAQPGFMPPQQPFSNIFHGPGYPQHAHMPGVPLDVPDYMRMSMSKFTTGWAASPLQAAPGRLSSFADIYRHRAGVGPDPAHAAHAAGYPPHAPQHPPHPQAHSYHLSYPQHQQQQQQQHGYVSPQPPQPSPAAAAPEPSRQERRESAQAAFAGLSLAEVLASAPKRDPPPFVRKRLSGPSVSPPPPDT